MEQLNDLKNILNKLVSKIEGSFKTIEEQKKFEQALNDPEIVKKVDKMMIKIKEAMKDVE